jgi:hypothetical protein
MDNPSGLIGAFAALHIGVQVAVVLMAGVLIGILLFRLPTLADAIARIRGKGQTDREIAMAAQIEALIRKVASLESEVTSLRHRDDERSRLLAVLLPRAQCLVPGCHLSEVVDALQELFREDTAPHSKAA